MGPKVKPAQPQALPHGKKDGPRRTPKNVALLLVSSKVTLLDSFSSFQIFCELSRKNCTGRKLYRAVYFWLPNLYRPGTLLVAKSVPALPKVYRPGTILVTKSVPVLPKVCRVEH